MGASILSSLYGSMDSFSEEFTVEINEKLQRQKVLAIEERCTDLNSPSTHFLGKDSYLLLHTESGKLIRAEYQVGDFEPRVTYKYQDTEDSERFRYSVIEKEITVAEAIGIIRSHCLTKQYDISGHNSQHVARDSFSEISGNKTYLLREDYMRWLKKQLPKEVRKDFDADPMLEEMKNSVKDMLPLSKTNLKDVLNRYDKLMGPEIITANWKAFRYNDNSRYIRKIRGDDYNLEGFESMTGDYIPKKKDLRKMEEIFENFITNPKEE